MNTYYPRALDVVSAYACQRCGGQGVYHSGVNSFVCDHPAPPARDDLTDAVDFELEVLRAEVEGLSRDIAEIREAYRRELVCNGELRARLGGA